MSDMELKQVFTTPDGKQFDTKKEAKDYLRRPKIKEALNSIAEGNDELIDWMVDNTESITEAFSAGTIKRVSKSEKNKLIKALEHAVSLNDPKLAFITENHEALADSFRWPSVTRMSPEEKEEAVKTELTALADNNEEIADFVIENKEAILAAFTAGTEKKTINAKAAEGLAKWREEQKRLKAEQEAAAEEAEKKPAPKKK